MILGVEIRCIHQLTADRGPVTSTQLGKGAVVSLPCWTSVELKLYAFACCCCGNNHDQRAACETKVASVFIFQIVYTPSRGMSRQELTAEYKDRVRSKYQGGTLLTCQFPLVCSACLFIYPRTTCPRLVPPQCSGPSHVNNKQNAPLDMPTGQYDKGSFLIEIFSSQVITQLMSSL